eukprot:TRINITY_DN17497_c0_g1_i1.p1 TRINITY_DN17497_c0_g1~~TRINITY_DN17497_c0_g1_i1.p1  ORF type:complete len:608 (+),score=112.05 TRINITY_DN17497_c0_g1_i1:99-1922(+)
MSPTRAVSLQSSRLSSAPRTGSATVAENEERILGVIAAIGARTGFGFIRSPDVDGICGAHKRHLRGLSAGQSVVFSVYTNSKGKLRARRIVGSGARGKVVMRLAPDPEPVPALGGGGRPAGQCAIPLFVASPARSPDDAVTSECLTEVSPAPVPTRSRPLLEPLEYATTFQPAASLSRIAAAERRAAIAGSALEQERAARNADEIENAKQRACFVQAEKAMLSEISALKAQMAVSEAQVQRMMTLYVGQWERREEECRGSIADCYNVGLQQITQAVHDFPRDRPCRGPNGTAGPERAGGGTATPSRTRDAALDAISVTIKAEVQARRALAASCGSALGATLAGALHRCAAQATHATEAKLRAEVDSARRAVCELERQLRQCNSLRRIEQAAACLPQREESTRVVIGEQAIAQLRGMQELCTQRARKPAPRKRPQRHRARGLAAPQERVAPYTSQCTAQHAFSIETICHRIAVWAPYEWAQLSSMAPMTWGIVREWVTVWTAVMNFMISMQNTDRVAGLQGFAPAVNACRELMVYDLTLHHEISLVGGPDVGLKKKLLLRVQMIHHIFDEARIRFAELLSEVLPFYQSFSRFFYNLDSALHTRAARLR